MEDRSMKTHFASRRRVVLSGLAAFATAAWWRRTTANTASSPKRSATVAIEAFDAKGVSQGVAQVGRVVKTDEEWRKQLSKATYGVTRHEATERPFSGEYDGNHSDGLYRCICCDTALFDARTKF